MNPKIKIINKDPNFKYSYIIQEAKEIFDGKEYIVPSYVSSGNWLIDICYSSTNNDGEYLKKGKVTQNIIESFFQARGFSVEFGKDFLSEPKGNTYIHSLQKLHIDFEERFAEAFNSFCLYFYLNIPIFVALHEKKPSFNQKENEVQCEGYSRQQLIFDAIVGKNKTTVAFKDLKFPEKLNNKNLFMSFSTKKEGDAGFFLLDRIVVPPPSSIISWNFSYD